MIYWNALPNRIIDNYTVIYTRLCDNEKETITIEHGTSNSTAIYNLYPGLQYSISIIPVNVLGEGMEMTDTVTLNDSSTFIRFYITYSINSLNVNNAFQVLPLLCCNLKIVTGLKKRQVCCMMYFMMHQCCLYYFIILCIDINKQGNIGVVAGSITAVVIFIILITTGMILVVIGFIRYCITL